MRQSAQFALAEKGAEAIPAFAGVARDGKDRLARFHAIWGLGQIGRKDAAAYKEILPLLKDGDSEVRAQAAKTLGEGRVAEATDSFIGAAEGPGTARAVLRGAGSGPRRRKKGVPAVLDMLRDNGDKDAYLRHAGVMALVGSGDRDAWMAAADDASPAVRMAVLLALRRTSDPEVARYLNDADPLLVTEAARAINDAPIDAGHAEAGGAGQADGAVPAAGLSRPQRQFPPGAARKTPRPWPPSPAGPMRRRNCASRR